MPSKIRPGDWNYYFGPNAPRRGGPLRVLSNLLIFGLVLALLGVGGIYALNAYRTQRDRNVAVRLTSNAVQFVTQTVRAGTREAATTAAFAQTATAGAVTPTPAEATLGLGNVIAGGNLRQEPVVPAGAVIGLIWPGDEVTFLEQQSNSNGLWYRIRVTKEGSNRGGAGVPAGTEGWASSTLLTPPAP